MSFLDDYVAYVKDNPNGYWFKRKPYGWGWTPVTREGWFVIVVFILLIVGNAWRLDITHSDGTMVNTFVMETLLPLVLLVLIAYKTGEKPKWQWRLPHKRENKKDKDNSKQ